MIEQFLRDQPIALLFVILALGYLIGKTKIRGFEFGPVTGVLFAGLVFGHFGFEFIPAGGEPALTETPHSPYGDPVLMHFHWREQLETQRLSTGPHS